MTNPSLEIATLGGGCFWCTEAALLQLQGIERIVSGYAGGQTDNPDYRSICTGDTGHAEVVQVYFDPAQLDYRTLLQAFFAIHDPTTLNRQGHDVGTQYRSVIFTHNAEQDAVARALIAELDAARTWPVPIVTAVLPVPNRGFPSVTPFFWPAEDYHQNYFAKNPYQSYCQAVAAPKVAKLRKLFVHHLKKS
jgi:peptide-methionine (S)-S-oxide reductase